MRREELIKQLLGLDDDLPSSKPAAKSVPWRANVVDGQYYVPLSQVADLLALNNILPAVRLGIEARVRAQASKKD